MKEMSISVASWRFFCTKRKVEKKIKEFWQVFCQKRGINPQCHVEVYAFGMDARQADDLATLVNQGIKTATTSAYDIYAPEERFPQVGDYNIILDGQDQPVCVTCTVVTETVAYANISAEHAYHEGEGDRSLAYWKAVHEEFFQEEYAQAGQVFDPQTARCYCEVFEKIE